jgi:hypothetical protein
MEKKTFHESFWLSQENAAKVNQEISRLKRHLTPWESLVSEVNDSIELLQIAQEENDLFRF